MTTQRIDCGLIIDYPNVGKTVTKAELSGKPVQILQPTVSTTAAAVWGTAATISPGTLNPGLYAVEKVNIYSATGKAFKLSHGDFVLSPGGPIGHTICHKSNEFSFADFDACPVFDSRETLNIDLLTVSAETPVITIFLVKVG